MSLRFLQKPLVELQPHNSLGPVLSSSPARALTPGPNQGVSDGRFPWRRPHAGPLGPLRIMRGWLHWVLAAGPQCSRCYQSEFQGTETKEASCSTTRPNTRWKGFWGWAVTFCKGLWDHRARTLDLSLDEVERHEGAPLLPLSGPRLQLALLQDGDHQPLIREQTHSRAAEELTDESRSFAEGGGSDPPPAEKMCRGRRRGWLSICLPCPGFSCSLCHNQGKTKRLREFRKQASMASQ